MREKHTAVAESGGIEHIGSWLTGLGCVREIVVAVSGATAPCFKSICFLSCNSSKIFLFVNSKIKIHQIVSNLFLKCYIIK